MSEYQGPYYRYDLQLLEETLSRLSRTSTKHNVSIKYALKANHNEELLKVIKSHGFGIDAVSAEEIEHALALGWNGNEIVFAGSGKTRRELAYALAVNVGCINCESVEEYAIINELKAELIENSTAIALRINPDLRVDTHEKISTGEKKHKFGMSFSDALALIQRDYSICGLHFHVGSQVEDLSYFEDLSLRVRSFIDQLPKDYSLSYLNLGGGLGIDYNQPEINTIPDFEGWIVALRKYLPESRVARLTIEPGRSIVGQCGQLIGQVQYIKNEDEDGGMAILDIGMTELLRPALYGASHAISTNPKTSVYKDYTVCGPSCESSDTFGANYYLPELSSGDIVTLYSCGAYGESMRLSYNLRKPIPAYYIKRNTKTCFKNTQVKMAV